MGFIKKFIKKRKFLYIPYAESGDAVLLYYHQRPTGNFDNTWDMTGVDVPTKECPKWSFWRNIQSKESGNDMIPHDLTKREIRRIKKYILQHKELVPRLWM